jgi:FKBP-type peptidyl-prolyl cis-trans isomerase
MKIFLLIIVTILFFSCQEKSDSNKEEKLPFSVIRAKHKEELLEWNKGLVEVDHSVIRKFIERRKWDMQVSPTGLYYQIYLKTNGEPAINGMIAEFSYKTSLLNGTVIYTSEEFGNRSLNLGHNQEESGLDEGIKMMKVGEKARFIMPPHLAFGVPGDGYKVPVYSIVVYEIELLSLSLPKEEGQ